MGRKLYVGNLPRSADRIILEKKFGEHGGVESITIITDRISGESRGFGFVEMSSDAEASKAIEQLNGSDCEGRSIVVNEAKPQKSRQSSGGGDNRFGRSRGRW